MADRNPQRPSFKTDVHRAKTQKWVNAPSYSYEGDDWGDDDDFDDVPPPPPPKTTGLRQRGQGSLASAAEPGPQQSTLRQAPSFERGQESHEFSTTSAWPPQPAQAQAQASIPAAVSAPAPPPAPPINTNHSPARSPNLSQVAMPLGADPPPPRRSPQDTSAAHRPNLSSQSSPQQRQGAFPSMQASAALPRPPQEQQYPSRQPPPQPQPGYYERRDYGSSQTSQPLPTRPRGQSSARDQSPAGRAFPSAHGQQPPPARPRGQSAARDQSPAGRAFTPLQGSQPPQVRSQGQSAAREQSPAGRAFPLRKQSITRDSQPLPGPQFGGQGPQQATASRQDRYDHGWVPPAPPRDALSPQSFAEPLSPGEPPPASFVRPADIYKRIEVEKERERQSLDTGRPSIDTINRAAAQDSTRAPRLPDLGNQESISRLRAPLDTVSERRSEYGMDGFPTQAPELAASVPPRVSPEPPFLPDINRFSAFGSDFMGGSSLGDSASSGPVELPASRFSLAPQATASAANAPPLQHQPSLGFRSVVEHAFEGQGSPSASRNPNASDVSRSNTDSTSGISPIMSRVPSEATASKMSDERSGQVQAPPAIAEESGSPDMRPGSTGTLHAPAMTVQSRSAPDDAPSVQSGYRRDQNLPQPHNIRTSTPEIARELHHQKSTTATMAVATPVSGSEPDSVTTIHPASSLGFANREADLAHAVNVSPTNDVPGAGVAEQTAQNQFMQTHQSPRLGPPATSSLGTSKMELHGPEAPLGSATSSRSASPNKGRVRDLANQLDALGGTGAAPGVSPTGSVSSWNSSTKGSAAKDHDAAVLTRPHHVVSEEHRVTPLTRSVKPGSDSTAPERPHLPGEWVSYATSVGSSDAVNASRGGSSAEYHDAQHEVDERDIPGASRLAKPLSGGPEEAPDFSPTMGESLRDAVNDPMAALRSAGTAMADSFRDVIGIQVHDKDDTMEVEDELPTPNAEAVPEGRSMRQSLGAETTSMQRNKDSPLDHKRAGSMEYFPAPKPLMIKKSNESRLSHPEEDLRNPTHTSLTPSALSYESSPADAESDRLRKDIARSLSPQDDQSANADWNNALPHSPVLLSERSPTAESGSPVVTQRPLSDAKADRVAHNPDSTVGSLAAHPTPGASRAMNLSRFSWETSGAQSSAPQSPNEREAGRSSGLNQMMSMHSPSTQPTGGEPTDPQDPAAREMQQRAIEDNAMRELGLTKPMPSDRTEASPDETQVSDLKHLPSVPMPASPTENIEVKTAITTPRSERLSATVPASSSAAANQHVPSFKEILALKQPWERIGTYKDTRQQFASMPTGLNEWLVRMVEAHPEHKGTTPVQPMVSTAGGSMRAAPSGLAASPSSAGIRNVSGSKTTKDFLQTAGFLGGKATVGAKGLFAKGKSRFRVASSTEKVD